MFSCPSSLQKEKQVGEYQNLQHLLLPCWFQTSNDLRHANCASRCSFSLHRKGKTHTCAQREKKWTHSRKKEMCAVDFFPKPAVQMPGKVAQCWRKWRKSQREAEHRTRENLLRVVFFSLNFYISTFFRCSLLLLRALFLVGAFFSENENQWVRAPVTGRFSLLVAPHVLPHESRPRSAIYLFLARFPRNCSALIPSKMAIHFACAKKTVPHAMYSHWPWIRPKIALSWEKKDV